MVQHAHAIMTLLISQALNIFKACISPVLASSQRQDDTPQRSAPLAQASEVIPSNAAGSSSSRKPNLSINVGLSSVADEEDVFANYDDVWRNDAAFMATVNSLAAASVSSCLFGDEEEEDALPQQPVVLPQLQHISLEPAFDGQASVICIVHSPVKVKGTGSSSNISMEVTSLAPRMMNLRLASMLPQGTGMQDIPSGTAAMPTTQLGVVGNLSVQLSNGSMVATPIINGEHAWNGSTSNLPLHLANQLKAKLRQELLGLDAKFEEACGRPMTKDDKQVLRPVYIQYHKLSQRIKTAQQMLMCNTAVAAV